VKAVALEKAKRLVEQSQVCLVAMENSADFKRLKSNWSDFLTYSQRINITLEQGSKDNGTSSAWWGNQRRTRKTDPLLRYVHHARNADEHGLADVTETVPGALALGVGPGSWRIDGNTGAPGQPGFFRVQALGGQTDKSVPIMAWPARVRLTRVIDRGVHYDPPQGNNHEVMSPVEAARVVVEHSERMIAEAAQLPAS
jgi:hypothetical protein